ncbi:MAG: hypothetical protein M1825_000327 [Sarcosagium campestre]|nr:MAG: hypothetical protein M1825_000327 [Sarcosagium campestre]
MASESGSGSRDNNTIANGHKSSSSPKSFAFNIGRGAKSKPSPLSSAPLIPSSSNGRHPKTTTLQDSDDDDETTTAQPELVAAFDHAAGGAIGLDGPTQDQPALVIKSQRNRDWREESKRKRRKGPVPGSERQQQVITDVVNGVSPTYGLTFVDKTSIEGASTVAPETTAEEVPVHQKTDDELALEALTGGDSSRKTNLVLAPAHNAASPDEANGWDARATEDDSFKADVSSRPDSASLADYAAVPVEEFGAALLRGMGWKEGDVIGKRKGTDSKPRVVARRPALLGIGAKETPDDVGSEPGAWGKAASGRGAKRKVDIAYNPVMRKNIKTGEMLTEDELKLKLEESKRAALAVVVEQDDWRDRRDRNLKRDGERKERRREERDGDRRHGDGSRRNRDEDRRHRDGDRRDSERRPAERDRDQERVREEVREIERDRMSRRRDGNERERDSRKHNYNRHQDQEQSQHHQHRRRRPVSP